jgi:hypothetical protein
MTKEQRPFERSAGVLAREFRHRPGAGITSMFGVRCSMFDVSHLPILEPFGASFFRKSPAKAAEYGSPRQSAAEAGTRCRPFSSSPVFSGFLRNFAINFFLAPVRLPQELHCPFYKRGAYLLPMTPLQSDAVTPSERIPPERILHET